MSDEARAEAERRMQEQREQVGLMVVEQTRFVEGFVQGAEWRAEREAERRFPLWLPTGDYEIDREDYSELDAKWQNEDTERDRAHFVQGAEWQAERDAERIAELEAEVEGIKRRDAEVGEDEGWWVGGAWGDYGEAVVPLRILSYVIDGKLDEKVTSIDPGFALTYAEQTARAEAAEAKLDAVRAYCVENTEG